MRKQATFSVLAMASLLVIAGGFLPTRLAAVEAKPMVREIFVPFEDLEVLMEAQPRRVLLQRSEYEALLKKAAKEPSVKAPFGALVVSADYTATIESGRAAIVGKLVVDVLQERLLAVDLDLLGVGLRRATLDGRSAPIGRKDHGGDDHGRLTLFVEGIGPHELVLEMVAPLETTAAKQQLRYHVPRPPAATFHLTVPGDVEVKSGAHVISRQVDAAAGVTRFELLPQSGDTTLVMTLNSRLLRSQRAVAAKSVIVDEVTEAYERLHATISLRVLHRAVDRFEFLIPRGFEVTDVASPLLARWAIQSENDRSVLEVYLREQTTETVLLNVSAVRTTTEMDDWSLPKIVPLHVVAQVAVVGLLVDERLNAESIVSEGLIPIDTSVLREAMPETVFQAAPGAPTLRPVVAWYAPQADFEVTARLVKPPKRLAVTTNLLLVLEDSGHQVQGGFLLRPEVEKLFAVDFSVPPGWHVESVTGLDEKPLSFERYGAIDQAGRIRVSLPDGVSPGEEYRLYFRARHSPAGWLTDWKSQTVDFPVFAVAQASHDLGAVALDARDDLVVRPDTLDQLTPLDSSQKERYLPGITAELVYRYEGGAYRATFSVERTSPRLTARTFSFIRVEPDALACHYEVIYTVEEARARRLALLLPADTPETLSIRGLDGVRLKEFVSTIEGDLRRWDIQLADPLRGRIRLAVDFQQPLSVENQQALALPILGAANVVWQSGLLAVEGHTELVVDVSPGGRARGVDVGELVDADYQPGRRLLGAFGFVGTPPEVSIDVAREPTYALSKTIVERAELLTRLSAHGQSQTAAVFELRTKATYLEIQLPAEAELWSADLNGTPIKPQREGRKLLVSLPAAHPGVKTVLHLVYQAPVEEVDVSGKVLGDVRMTAPRLFLRTQRDEPAVEVPTADLRWRLQPPPGYRVIDSGGTVVAAEDEPPELAMVTMAKATTGMFFLLPYVQAAREAGSIARQTAIPAYNMQDDAHYDKAGEEFKLAEGQTGHMGGEYDDADHAMKMDAMMQMEAMAEKEEPEAPAALIPAMVPEEPKEELGILEGRLDLNLNGVMEGEPADFDLDSNLDLVIRQTEQVHEQASGQFPGYVNKLSRLDGLRSLLIDLEGGQSPGDDTREVSFVSLGVKPELSVRLAAGFRLDALSWAVGAAVMLVGAMLTCGRLRSKVKYIVWMMLLGTLVGTLAPMFPGWSETVGPANAVVYAAGLLAPYYLAAGFVRWCLGLCCGAKCSITAASVALLFLCPLVVATAAEPKPQDDRFVIQMVEPPEPVAVPEDAVILPYDPESETGIQDANRMLVPYDKYVELWNRAYPDQKIETRKPPVDYGLAGASYTTVLEGTDYLLIEGRLQIDVFSDRPVTIPLSLSGGVLQSAELDGKPARLSVPQVEPPKNNAPAQQAQKQATQPGSLVVLHAEGRRRHELQIAVRMRLDRRGGWRVARGSLPSAPATALSVRVPEAETEVRMSQVADRTSYETEAPGEVIETALGPGGSLYVEWRPKVAEADVDPSLTVQSTAVLDVQEDGLRLSWELALEFRRSQHDRFLVQIPGDYLLEKVAGTNVRGWEIEPDGSHRIVEVSLLKAARDSERFTLSLWRKGAVQSGSLAEFDVPVVKVGDAALHGGQITIRRSPFLDVRTVTVSGASRADLAARDSNSNQIESTAAGTEESPLGIRPYQAYRFPSSDYAIRLAASPVVRKSSAEVQTVLRVAEYERSLQSRVTLRVEARPIHRIEILLPVDLELDDVSAGGEFQWALTRREDRPLLTVYLAAGQTGSVPVLITGKLPLEASGESIPLPNIKVLGVDRQEGDIAVQVDPAFAVAAQNLRNCQEVLPERLYRWLDEKQRRRVNTLPLHYRGGDYSGLVKLSPRVPEVDCNTVTNVRVTDRAVEETILLDFNIRKAGIREVSFLLPATMADCRIEVPMLRQKTISPESDGPNARLRVRLQLQDEVMNQFRVLVENDRLLEPDTDYRAPVPVVEKGTGVGEFSVRHFVALESAGRDELVVDAGPLSGLQRLSRQQEDWKELQRILGDGITEAYLVTGDAADARLVFRTRQRTTFETPGAEIGLAEATLVFDASGAYRAEQIFWIDNQTEQFLDVRLPQRAHLWTAQLFTHGQWTARASGAAVSGEPVKPTEVPGAKTSERVRVPLVRTQPGDLDYVVRLTYGGQISALDKLSHVEFPLVHTENIQVGLSQVRLYLPKSHRFDFDGTMRLVDDRGELSANRFAYQTRKAESLREVLRHANPFAQARAANNLKQLGLAAHNIHNAMRDYPRNVRLQEEASKNARMFEEAQREIQQLGDSLDEDTDGTSNRARLRVQVQEQETARARNVVNELGSNFDAGAVQARQPATQDDGRFNKLWLDNSQLSNPAVAKKPDVSKDKKRAPAKGQFETKSRLSIGKKSLSGRLGELLSPGISQKPARSTPRAKPGYQAQRAAGERREAVKQIDEVARYQRKHLEQQLAETARPATSGGQDRGRGLAGSGGMMGGGMGGYGGADYQNQIGQSEVPQAGRRFNRYPSSASAPQPYGGFAAPADGQQAIDRPFQVFGRPVDDLAEETTTAYFDRRNGEMAAAGVEAALSPDGAQIAAVAFGQVPAAALPAGLASLDVQLPERGDLYLFTKPRGDVEITARAVSRELISTLGRAIFAVAAAVLALVVVRLGCRGGFDWVFGSRGSTCLILLVVLIPFVPAVGLFGFISGVMIKINRWRARRAQAGLTVAEPKPVTADVVAE